MPFSSLSDPVDVAKAQAALDRAWEKLVISIPPADRERERIRLSYIIAAYALAAMDEDDLVSRALERFRRVGDGRNPVF